MTPPIALSQASERTSNPAISTLMALALARPELISLAAGFVDRPTLPIEDVEAIVKGLAAAPTEGQRALQYGTTAGDVGLRNQVLRLVERSEGLPPGELDEFLPRTVITTGSQQLLYLVCEALLDPGDIVLVESPTYFVFLGVLESRGARVVGVETDEGGLRLDALDAAFERLRDEGRLGRVKLVYTVSEHSNPSGISLAEDRRGAMVEAVKRWSGESRRIFILEDAAYRGVSFEGREPPSVWSHDLGGETVIHARTFSKTFSPGLKTGYGILPADLVAPVLRLKGNHDFGSSNFNAVLLERVLASGTYQAHVARLVDRYRTKRDALLDALETHLGSVEGVSWTRPKGGIYVWVRFPEGLDAGPDGPLFARCVDEGVIYVPGEFAFAGGPGGAPRNHARLCYGVASEADLFEGVRRLAAALAGCLDPVS